MHACASSSRLTLIAPSSGPGADDPGPPLLCPGRPGLVYTCMGVLHPMPSRLPKPYLVPSECTHACNKSRYSRVAMPLRRASLDGTPGHRDQVDAVTVATAHVGQVVPKLRFGEGGGGSRCGYSHERGNSCRWWSGDMCARTTHVGSGRRDALAVGQDADKIPVDLIVPERRPAVLPRLFDESVPAPSDGRGAVICCEASAARHNVGILLWLHFSFLSACRKKL